MKTWFAVFGGAFLAWLAISGLLYWGSTYLDIVLIRVLCILLLWALPFSIGLSFYFGKVEARGFLRGADQMLEKILGPTIQNIEKYKKPEAPPIVQVLPGEYPQELQMSRDQSYSVFDYPDDVPRLHG